MGQFDYREQRLPSGDVTTGAERFKEGVPTNATPGVVEHIITSNRLNADYQKLIDANTARGPIPGHIQDMMEDLAGTRRARFIQRMRFFVVFFLCCATLSFVVNQDSNRLYIWGFFISAALSVTRLYVPKLTDAQKQSSISQRLSSGTGHFSGFMLFIFGVIIICISSIGIYPVKPLDSPNKTMNYSYIGYTQSYSTPQEARNEVAEKLAFLYKPGTNLMNLFKNCVDKGCTFPNEMGFVALSDYKKDIRNFNNDLCSFMYSKNYLTERVHKIKPQWYVDVSRGNYLSCTLHPDYLEKVEAENNATHPFHLAVWSVFSLIWIGLFSFVFIRSARHF